MTVDPKRALILVVDDEPDILSLNRLILEKSGYQVVTAGDGVQAIQKAFDFLPDLIILDVMMPRMNGYQVCRLLKNSPRTADIPIIICTVKSLESEKLYAYTSGADNYLVKPFDHTDLTDLVEKQLDNHPPRDRTRQSGEGATMVTSTDSILSDVNRLLDRRLMELTILHNLTRSVSGTLDLDGILDVILKRVVHDLGYPGGMILLLDDKGSLVEHAPRRTDPLILEAGKFPGIARTMVENDVVIVRPEEMEDEMSPEFRRRVSSPKAILVPIHSKGRPIGLLVVESGYGSRLSAERDQKEFLLTVASQAGMAIENANLYARTLELSRTDGLTNIYNYRYFRERLDVELSRGKRYGTPVGLFIIDIDHFKAFNDRYGHLIGDEVLKKVAEVLTVNTRDIDVVARYGGEEFGIILTETGVHEVRAYAERIREAVEATAIEVSEEEERGITVSIGVSVCCTGEMDGRELIRLADAALYRAKDEGRNRVCLWDEEQAQHC